MPTTWKINIRINDLLICLLFIYIHTSLCPQFEAALFMVDDIIDGSEIRRNLPCWHTLSDVKMQSINDMLMLENGTFVALRRYIGHKDYYPRIFQMFSEVWIFTPVQLFFWIPSHSFILFHPGFICYIPRSNSRHPYYKGKRYKSNDGAVRRNSSI